MATQSVARRDAAEGGAPGQRGYAHLVIVRPSDGRFVVWQDGLATRCPRVPLSADQPGNPTLRGMVQAGARRHLGLHVNYLRLLSLSPWRDTYELTVLARLETSTADPLPGTANLHEVTLAQARANHLPAEQSGWLERAERLLATEQHAASVGPLISQAFERSTSLLEANAATEQDGPLGTEHDRILGWSQYLDGTVGILSTAQGLLAFVHAGHRGGLVEDAAQTLEKIQNTDGGWRVRRALVGYPSERSLTDSTCYCLWALFEAGRTRTDKSVRRAVEWLERTQTAEGGWKPSEGVGDVQVSATAAAVRTLALFGVTDTVRRGVGWLQAAQQSDGGWGETHPSQNGLHQQSSPAYTAHAVIALLAAAVSPNDRSVVRGCAYLEETFQPDASEPWPATSSNTLVDTATSARLDYRHFATPWSLAALSRAGRDLGDPTILAGVTRLLSLQKPNGAWRCSLTAPDSSTVWVLHDALFALHAVRDAGVRNLSPAATAASWSQERGLLEEAVGRLLTDRPAAARRLGRRWLQTAWMSLLTVVVALLVAASFGLFEGFQSDSDARQAITAVLTALISALGAVMPAVVGEEYKLWRNRRTSDRPVN